MYCFNKIPERLWFRVTIACFVCSVMDIKVPNYSSHLVHQCVPKGMQISCVGPLLFAVHATEFARSLNKKFASMVIWRKHTTGLWSENRFSYFLTAD